MTGDGRDADGPEEYEPYIPPQLKAAIDNEDDLGAIIRVHLLAERALTELIELGLPGPGAFMPRSFYHKNELAHALGLTDPLVYDGILVLNEVRNRLAHRDASPITQAEVEDMCDVLGMEIDPEMPPGTSQGQLMRGAILYLFGWLESTVYRLREKKRAPSQTRRTDKPG